MLRIAICCGQGFMSGFLSRFLAEGTVKEGLQERVSFIFIPFFELYGRQNEIDIAMLLPHIEPFVKNDQREYSIPMYIIPFKVIVKPKVEDYVEDAEDIMEMSQGKGGLYCFPGEERTAVLNRLESHRKWEAKQKK